MALTALKALETIRDAWESGNTDAVSEIITDDSVYVPTEGATRSKEEFLLWMASTRDLRIADLEVLYENDEVMVGLHSVVRAGVNGKNMVFARKTDDKLSYWRSNRAIITG